MRVLDRLKFLADAIFTFFIEMHIGARTDEWSENDSKKVGMLFCISKQKMSYHGLDSENNPVLHRPAFDFSSAVVILRSINNAFTEFERDVASDKHAEYNMLVKEFHDMFLIRYESRKDKAGFLGISAEEKMKKFVKQSMMENDAFRELRIDRNSKAGHPVSFQSFDMLELGMWIKNLIDFIDLYSSFRMDAFFPCFFDVEGNMKDGDLNRLKKEYNYQITCLRNLALEYRKECFVDDENPEFKFGDTVYYAQKGVNNGFECLMEAMIENIKTGIRYLRIERHKQKFLQFIEACIDNEDIVVCVEEKIESLSKDEYKEKWRDQYYSLLFKLYPDSPNLYYNGKKFSEEDFARKILLRLLGGRYVDDGIKEGVKKATYYQYEEAIKNGYVDEKNLPNMGYFFGDVELFENYFHMCYYVAVCDKDFKMWYTHINWKFLFDNHVLSNYFIQKGDAHGKELADIIEDAFLTKYFNDDYSASNRDYLDLYIVTTRSIQELMKHMTGKTFYTLPYTIDGKYKTFEDFESFRLYFLDFIKSEKETDLIYKRMYSLKIDPAFKWFSENNGIVYER